MVFLDQCEISICLGNSTVQNTQDGRKPPYRSLEPRPAVLLSLVNYSSVSGEEGERGHGGR